MAALRNICRPARLFPGLLAIAPLFAAFAGAALGDEPAAQIVPVERAPFHAPVFRNDFVAMVDAYLPAGRVTPWHRHTRDYAYVMVRESELVIQNWGMEPEALRWPRGHVGFGAFSKTSLVHMATNTGQSPAHLVGFEFLRPAPAGFETSRRPAGYVRVMDNERLRGWRVRLAPGAAIEAFAQTAPSVRIVIEGGELVETAEGRDHNVMLSAGGFQWRDAGMGRALRNAGAAPIDFVEFELK